MWSDWFEHIHLYLGKNLAMLRTKRHGERVIQLEENLTTSDVLERLSGTMSQMGIARKKVPFRLEITLSGALCPATTFTAPQTVKRWDELQSIACGSAALTTGLAPEQTLCEVVGFQTGLSASIDRLLFDQLKQWGNSQHCRVSSVQPLWSVASESKAARPESFKGIWLQEPDATTIVSLERDSKCVASTLLHEQGINEVQLRRWLVSLDINQASLLKLRFDHELHPRLPSAPERWASHWTLVGAVP